MTSHAVVHWDEEGVTRREEIVSPPQVLEDGTAESMWAALGRQIPLHQLLDADLAALLCSPDSAKANVRLMGHMFSLLPDNVLAIFLGCMHHQLDLVPTHVTKELNMLCTAFCTAKQMQNGVLLTGMEDALLDILKEAPFEYINDGDPDPADIGFAEKVLEKTLYKKNAGEPGLSEDEIAEIEREDKVRRKEGKAISCMISTNWRISGKYGHHCKKPRCIGCDGPEHALRKAHAALCAPLRRRIAVPAQNRWMTLYEVLCVLSFFFCVSDLYVRAFVAACFGGLHKVPKDFLKDKDEEAEEQSEGENMGAPADETKAWRKIEAKRRRKALEWVADPEMRVNRILLLPLAALFTRLQCHFFKKGKSLGDESGTEILLNLCTPRQSRAVKSFQVLGAAGVGT